MKRREPRQQQLAFATHGGRREGAGRKKDKLRNLVGHGARPELDERKPAHVTLRLRKSVWNLRTRRCFRVIERALRESKEMHADARFVHFSVLGNHVHLIVEATDRHVLARRVQGLEVRIARALNGVMRRKGRVFADRYHARVLKGPREVRNAIGYVLRNAFRHYGLCGVDEFSSGAWFDGWQSAPRERPTAITRSPTPPTGPPESWVLRAGWKRLGLIALPRRGRLGRSEVNLSRGSRLCRRGAQSQPSRPPCSLANSPIVGSTWSGT